MTDIVERLRVHAKNDHVRGCEGRTYSCSCGYDEKTEPLLDAAADEIERLRAALRKVAERYPDHEDMLDIARNVEQSS
jgi:hypothetical protein